MKKVLNIWIVAALVAFVSCKKEIDTPPVNTLPEGSVITIDSLRNMFQGVELEITEDISVYATVTMDEADGNIYKNIYVQDETGAINVRLPRSGGYFKGDYIRMALKGTTINSYNGVFQIDNIEPDANLIKQEANRDWAPEHTTIAEINQFGLIWESQLFHLDSVQFLSEELGETYGDAINGSSVNHTLTDCSGNRIIVRSSGFADFANEKLATGKGSITCILGRFNDELQLYIRSFDEIKFDGERCNDGTFVSLIKNNFEGGDITDGGWSTQVVTGTYDWTLQSFGGNQYAYMSNHSGGAGGSNTASETWLISPALDIAETTSPVLEFQTARNYNGGDIEVLVSTDFDGTSPVANATWTKLSPTLSTGNWNWVGSGALDLTDYKSATTYIAFKYVGTDNDGATWEVDDVVIREN